MARRDVDLVIRARDEAAKVLDTITKTLSEFNAAQVKTASGAAKTKEAMADISGAFTRLDSAMKGMQAAAKVAAEMDKATSATERTRAALAGTTAELDRLKTQEAAASAAVADMTRKLDESARALKAEKAALEQARAAQGQLKAEVANTTSALAGLNRTFARQTESIAKQEGRVKAASERYAELAASVAAAEKPTKTLVRSMEASQRAVDRETAKLAALRAAHAAVGQEVTRTGEAATKLAARLDEVTARVDGQGASVKKVAESHAKLRGQMATTTRAQKTLSDQVQSTSAVWQRQTDQLNRAEAELVQLGAAATVAAGKIAQLEAAGAKGLRLQIGTQARTVREAAAEQAKAAAEANRLAAEIGKVGVPTREMAQAFERAKIASGQAKQEFILQRNALGNMRQAMREAGTSTEGLAVAQKRMAEIQAQTGAGLASARQRTAALTEAMQRLFAETTKVARSQRDYATGTGSAGQASARAATAVDRLKAAYQNLYGDSRQALSLTQRWRGEVLALITTYAGFYGVVNILKQVVAAYQTVEAAQSRLNVVMDGDLGATAKELDWIRRTAEFLGIEFGVLANQYTKFAVAAKGTNLEGEATRKIFLSVAAAARVNKASTEQIEGTFLALEQMVSKGSVTMEELRRQLGDRLPGAVQIMADAVGVSVKELTKMIELGQVSSDYLVQFAEKLDERFGPGLTQALKSTTTAIGQFQNAAFQALLTFGNSGFMESFTELVRDLTEMLKSAEFEDFIARMSRLAAIFVDAIGLVIKNFTLFATVAGAALGVRLITPITLLIGALKTAGASALAAGAGMTVLSRSATASAGAATVATGAITRMAAAIRVLMATTGVGLAVVAATAAAAYFLTAATDATEAMVAHKRVVDDVKNAYEKAEGGAKNWAKAISETTRTQAVANLTKLRSELDAARISAANVVAVGQRLRSTLGGTDASWTALERVTDMFKKGGLSVKAYQEAVKDIFQGDVSFSNTLLDRIVATTDGMKGLEKAGLEAEAVLVLLSENASEEAKTAARAFLQMGESAVEAARKVERDLDAKTKKFAETLETIKGLVPEIGKELEYLAKSKALDDLEAQALRTASSYAELLEVFGLIDRARANLNREFGEDTLGSLGGATDGVSAAAALLRKFEGFRATPYWDVNAYRTGFGSDTITLSDGTIKKVTQGMTVSVEDANRDLIRRITTEFMPAARNATGAARFDAFTPGQQAALTSIAYNYGSLPDRILEAVRTGSAEQIASAIEGLAGDNGGVNSSRRMREASLFRSGVGVEQEARRQEEADKRAADEAARKAEAAAKFRAETAASLSDQELELSLQNASNVEREVALALRQAERRAAAAGVELTEEERRRITEITRQKFQQKDLDEAQAATKERVQKAEEAVNQLLEQRNALEEQMRMAVENQDADGAEALRAKIAEVNGQLIAAIANAQEMWRAVGGQAAESAIARLETAKLKAQEFGNEGKKSWVDWKRVGELFVSGLTNAFDRFAQSVAEGKSIGEAAREAFLQFAADFLREIAQMIIRQAILNALQGTKLGGLFQIPVAHSGLRIGSESPSRRRSVHPGVFAGAQRYHTGGFPGLRPNEVPIIAELGEEVLDKNDPRNALNGGLAPAAGGTGGRNVKIVNMLAGRDIAEAITADDDGSEVLMNFFRANKTTLQAILGG